MAQRYLTQSANLFISIVRSGSMPASVKDIAEKALLILEIPVVGDPVRKLAEVSSLNTERSDISFSKRIVALLLDGKTAEAETLLDTLTVLHSYCGGGPN